MSPILLMGMGSVSERPRHTKQNERIKLELMELACLQFHQFHKFQFIFR